MRIVRENNKVEILRNKRKGLKLRISENNYSFYPCRYCFLLRNKEFCLCEGGNLCTKINSYGYTCFLPDEG